MRAFRQSHLRSSQDCMRRAIADMDRPLDLTVGNTESTADLGTFVHVVCDRYLQALKENEQPNMGANDLEALMHEVYAEIDIILPAEDFHDAGWMLRQFAEIRWDWRRIMALEVPLAMEIVGPDGETRLFTGRPDVLYSDPPHGIICLDYKTGRAKPREPRVMPDNNIPVGWEYLSHRGRYQGNAYAALIVANYPTCQYVIFRELNLRSGTWPESPRITRQQVEEHIVPKLGMDMVKLEQAREDPESPLAKPRPGRWCARQCPVAQSCPIPWEQRGEGSIGSEGDATAAVDRWLVVRAQADGLRAQLKAWHEAGNVARGSDGREARWEPAVGRGRKFDVHEPVSVEAM